jgi:hypothetical protein
MRSDLRPALARQSLPLPLLWTLYQRRPLGRLPNALSMRQSALIFVPLARSGWRLMGSSSRGVPLM